jgi:hypothetical protein
MNRNTSHAIASPRRALCGRARHADRGAGYDSGDVHNYILLRLADLAPGMRMLTSAAVPMT